MLALVGDLGRVNLDVDWLQKRLEEILEVIVELIKQSSQIKCYGNETIREQKNQRESKQDIRFYVIRPIVPTSTELQRFYYIGE